MAHSLGLNDGLFLSSLLYSCVDLICEWDNFSSCSRPIHQWLVVSYACVIGFRLTHLAGMHTSKSEHSVGSESTVASAGDFLMNLRHKDAVPRFLASITWLLTLPFFTLWTCLGTSWLWKVVTETPDCTPAVTHLWFCGFWLALCYIWVAMHVAMGAAAFVLERRVRRAETNLRAIEDPDVRARWGNVSQLSDFWSMPGLPGAKEGGLTPAEILALPCTTVKQRDVEAEPVECIECSICLNEVEADENVRHLPTCHHTFHKACIDLWLLRSTDCPLCKQCVRQ